jgi:Adenylate and Guanylate cyclase catalytic domain
VSDVYFPIFDSNGPDKQMKSVLTAYVYWQAFFQDILPEDAVGVYVTLKNSCNQSFSYEVNGKTATYLGKGDVHEPKYDHMMVETGYGAVLGDNVPEDSSGTTQCYYNVQVFPSQVMENEFMTSTPMLFSGCLASIFCFTCLVFMLYDWCVGRRHRKVHDTAVKSGAVVRSLFPAKVVDRLYESAENKNVSSMLNANDNLDVFRKDSRDMLSLEKSNRDQNSYGDIASSDPIADLYPDCTVYFADIAGFTKWSTGRPPCDVFRFLETLYSAFDKTAKELGVFKIETIGDCYVAVTGLPDSQPNHADRMARFAAECMVQMNQVLHKLVPVLGPETAFLSMRAGLHSGAVTAGILRGEKARCKSPEAGNLLQMPDRLLIIWLYFNRLEQSNYLGIPSILQLEWNQRAKLG